MLQIRNPWTKNLYDISFKINKYASNGNTQIQMLYNDDLCEGLPYGSLTMNIEKLPENQAYIDSGDNGKEILDWVTENNLGKYTGISKICGFYLYHLFELNMDEIKRHLYVEGER